MEEQRKQLSKNTYLIGSGKGGVGKSTVTVNLAVALAQQGHEVGILDADIYGPSIPIMTGLRRLSPRIQDCGNGIEKVIPFTKFGIHVISIGFFMEEARSVSWRGPMLHGTLQKLISDVQWGDLDYLLIDLPPGTGDVPISLSQLLTIDGAIVVTTPQEVAFLDAIKAINSFHQLEIPLTGFIENMAGYFVPETKKLVHLFGNGNVEELAQRFQSNFLGRIPLIPEIATGCDEGIPAASHKSEHGAEIPFQELANAFLHVVKQKKHVSL